VIPPTGALDDNETIAASEMHFLILNMSFLVLNMKTHVLYDAQYQRKYSPAFHVAHIIANRRHVINVNGID
jgi:hypothetical protein